jgi:dihydrofolate reductase
MIITFVVAVSENNAIGVKNQLPWHLPDDLKFFKRTTLGKPIIMGRKTFESFGNKPLPGRLNVVLSSQKDLELPEGIGGGKTFEEAMDLADRMYITQVKTVVPDADAFFPHVDHSQWVLEWKEDHEADEKHKYPFTFQRFERIAL